MKIAVDCYEVTAESTGVGRVIHNILLSLCQEESPYEFLACTREKIKDYSDCRTIKQCLFAQNKGYFRWQNGPFFKKIKKIHPDLVVAPNYTLPFFIKSKSILFEHDISFVSHPEWFTKKEVLKRKYLVKRSIKKASLVITLSEFSKQEIIRHFSVFPEKIKVMYLGVGERFKPAEVKETSGWKQKKGLKNKKIIGYLGSIFNRRNIPLLVDSVRLLREEFPEIILYIIGKNLTFPRQPLERILNENWIIWEESIPESELPLFFSSLDAFAYLSEYEGFGLPPLESLACGSVPVLLKRSALEEVYPELSIMIENPEIKEVKNGLEKVLTDREKVRKILGSFEKKRKYFSWDRVAEQFKKFINEAAGEE